MTDRTETRILDAPPDVREAMLDAVREAKGRRAICPASTLDGAALDVEAFLVCPEWATGETAAHVAAETLREVHRLDVYAGQGGLSWALYAEAARRLGFPGPVPIPTATGAHAGRTGVTGTPPAALA